VVIARALAKLAGLKADRPERLTRVNKAHLARALEARRQVQYTEVDRIVERLRGLGYDVRFGFDSDVGDYAEVLVDGRLVASANRLGSIEACLRQVAGELGVQL